MYRRLVSTSQRGILGMVWYGMVWHFSIGKEMSGGFFVVSAALRYVMLGCGIVYHASTEAIGGTGRWVYGMVWREWR
jgi:hypothetical protein